MKRLIFILTTILSVVFFPSCDKDYFNLDSSDDSSDYWITTGTVVLTENGFYIHTDDGFNFVQENDELSTSDLMDGMRLLFYYEIEEEATNSELFDYYIDIKSYEEILTKPIFNFTEETTEEIIDSIGNTPIHIVDTWLTDDFLNIQFEYYGNNLMHYVNLVFDSTNPETENGEILLELKHNDNDDEWTYVNWGIVSFDISKLQNEEEESIKIYVRSLGYYDQYEYNQVLTYDYLNDDLEMSSVYNPTRIYNGLPDSIIK